MSESNSNKLAALLKQLRSQTDGETAEGAIIDAAAFLDGNEDEGSLGCNLMEHPGMQAFRDAVSRVAARPDVSSVKVVIHEDMGDDNFPFTDSMFVCTSAAPKDIAREFEVLQPDDVSKAERQQVASLPPPPRGQNWIYVWWD